MLHRLFGVVGAGDHPVHLLRDGANDGVDVAQRDAVDAAQIGVEVGNAALDRTVLAEKAQVDTDELVGGQDACSLQGFLGCIPDARDLQAETDEEP